MYIMNGSVRAVIARRREVGREGSRNGRYNANNALFTAERWRLTQAF
jgi:hypothetical protein